MWRRWMAASSTPMCGTWTAVRPCEGVPQGRGRPRPASVVDCLLCLEEWGNAQVMWYMAGGGSVPVGLIVCSCWWDSKQRREVRWAGCGWGRCLVKSSNLLKKVFRSPSLDSLLFCLLTFWYKQTFVHNTNYRKFESWLQICGQILT